MLSWSALSDYGSASHPKVSVGCILSSVIFCPALFLFLQTPVFCLELTSCKLELEYT